MEALRYKISKEAESSLIEFLKISQTLKNRNENCDLESYEIWSKLLPPDPVLQENVNKKDSAVPVIDLCSDEELEVREEVEEQNREEKKTSISDIAFVIKENLQTQNDLSNVTKQHFKLFNNNDLEQIFEVLQGTLNNEEIYCFGIALLAINSEHLVSFFCHHLLMPEMKKEYTDNILELFEKLILTFPTPLIQECVAAIPNLSQEEMNIILQYFKKINAKSQSMFARNLIFGTETLNDRDLIFLDVLTNSELDYEALTKLVNMLSNVAEDYNRDKLFGKLLLTVVEALGPEISKLEQPLRHIISGHRSVWKSKLEKGLKPSYEDSMMFTQSFRE